MKYRVALIVFWLLGQVANVLATIRMAVSVVRGDAQGKRIGIGYDQLGHTAFNGDPDETISSHAGRAARKGRRWGCVLCRFLDWFEQNHCEKSIERRFLQLIAKRELRKTMRRLNTKRHRHDASATNLQSIANVKTH